MWSQPSWIRWMHQGSSCCWLLSPLLWVFWQLGLESPADQIENSIICFSFCHFLKQKHLNLNLLLQWFSKFGPRRRLPFGSFVDFTILRPRSQHLRICGCVPWRMGKLKSLHPIGMKSYVSWMLYTWDLPKKTREKMVLNVSQFFFLHCFGETWHASSKRDVSFQLFLLFLDESVIKRIPEKCPTYDMPHDMLPILSWWFDMFDT